MRFYLFALLIGAVAGSRTFTAPAAISWAARFQWLHLSGTPLGFLGSLAAPFILTLLAIGELIIDKLPSTPSRKAPTGFIARIMSGAFCGAALSLAGGSAFAACSPAELAPLRELWASRSSAPGWPRRLGAGIFPQRWWRTPVRSPPQLGLWRRQGDLFHAAGAFRFTRQARC